MIWPTSATSREVFEMSGNGWIAAAVRLGAEIAIRDQSLAFRSADHAAESGYNDKLGLGPVKLGGL